MTTIETDRLDEIKARAAAATPGPWMWEGNTDTRQISLATKYWGRWVVMGFRRWGMQGAQPMFAQGRKPGPPEDRKGDWGPFTNGDPGRLTDAERLARYEVCPTATSRKDQRVYRADLNGIRNADATFIEKSREDIDWLLAEVDRLRALVACECNGGKPCDCPDCDCSDCGYQQPEPDNMHAQIYGRPVITVELPAADVVQSQGDTYHYLVTPDGRRVERSSPAFFAELNRRADVKRREEAQA